MGRTKVGFIRDQCRRLKYVGLKTYILLLAKLRGAKIRKVADVNSQQFLSTIPSGAHGVVAGFDQIFSGEAIASFGSLVNFHPSILPFYRGPVPSYWVLRNQERVTGFTLHRITEKIDAGRILFQKVIECDGVCEENQLNRKIALAARETFDRYLPHLLSGVPWRHVQLDAASIYSVHLNYGHKPSGQTASDLSTRREVVR